MRDFAKTRRIVIKVGTNVLSREHRIDTDFLRVIARQIAALVKQKKQVILVTSGALGMGAGALGIRHKIQDVKKRQACAAVGQSILMQEYRAVFRECDQEVAQVLLTNNLLNHRKYYVNLKNTLETLLQMGVVPIINENDCVSIEEIDLAFGDNDKLSALVASKIDAELLIILTDVDGLYDKNPRKHRNARQIPTVFGVTPEIEAMAGKTGSTFGTGGMISKLRAVRIAADAGCKAVLAEGRADDVLERILAGEQLGTLFLPRRKLSNRKRWVLNCPAEARIAIDAGAEKALHASRSLLLVGITDFDGTFTAGDVVQLGDAAKGIIDVSSEQLADLLANKTNGAAHRKAIAHANNIVLLTS